MRGHQTLTGHLQLLKLNKNGPNAANFLFSFSAPADEIGSGVKGVKYEIPGGSLWLKLAALDIFRIGLYCYLFRRKLSFYRIIETQMLNLNLV